MHSRILVSVGVAAAFLSTAGPGARADMTIDDFSFGTQYAANTTPIATNSSQTITPAETASDASILGGSRDMQVVITNKLGVDTAVATVQTDPVAHILDISTPSGFDTLTTLTYDGLPGHPGMTPIDLTTAGNYFRIDVRASDLAGSNMTITAWAGASSTALSRSVTTPGTYYLAFSDFATPSVLAAVTKLDVSISGVNSYDGQVSFIGVAVVPEPTTLVLLAFGLAALARRRRP